MAETGISAYLCLDDTKLRSSGSFLNMLPEKGFICIILNAELCYGALVSFCIQKLPGRDFPFL